MSETEPVALLFIEITSSHLQGESLALTGGLELPLTLSYPCPLIHPPAVTQAQMAWVLDAQRHTLWVMFPHTTHDNSTALSFSFRQTGEAIRGGIYRLRLAQIVFSNVFGIRSQVYSSFLRVMMFFFSKNVSSFVKMPSREVLNGFQIIKEMELKVLFIHKYIYFLNHLSDIVL